MSKRKRSSFRKRAPNHASKVQIRNKGNRISKGGQRA